MKKIIITIITMVIITTAIATAKEWQEQCGDITRLAGTIMETRQLGASMQSMMESLSMEDQKNFGAMVVDAYEQPLFSTPEYRKETVEKFKNKWCLYCVKRLRK